MKERWFAIKSLIAALFIFCCAMPVWASGHGGPHYAKVTVTATPTGNGKVYMTTDADYAPTGEDWQNSMSGTWNCDDGVDDENDSRIYYVHAQPTSGYHFVKWSSNSSGSDSKSTAAKYAYSTSASSTSSGSPTANNIYAIFAANPVYTCTFLTSENGTFKYQYGSSGEVTVESQHSVTTNQNFTFTALPEAGYTLYGWYTKSGETKTYFDYTSTTISSYALPGNISIGVDFMPVGTPIFQIKGSNQTYTDLNAAISACGAATKTIVLINNGTLPAENYTIPANVTLLIPFDEGFTCYTTTPALTTNAFLTPEVYRTLTMAPGATLTVNGAISVSAKLSSRSGYGPNGATSGKYGAIKMLSGGNTKSKITLNSGAKLYGWGYIYGEGAIEALSGSTVYEGFDIMDWRGGNNTLDMYDNRNTYKVFPFNQYYIQNIEVPLTLHKGATESVYSSVYGNGSDNPLSITMVGTSEGLFRLTGTGAKLTKWYDPLYDRQHYELEGAAAINAISFTAMGMTVSSSAFVLPITNNMDITVRSGATVSIAEDVCIMADASVTVEQGATMNIASGKNVYVYDKNAYTNAGTYTTSRDGYPSAGPGRYAAGAYVRRISYSPSWAALSDREIRRLQNMSSAHFQVNGTLNVNGKLYTTEGGADIFNTADGAAIRLVSGAGTANKTYQVDHENYDAYYYTIPVTSALLHNADGSYQATAGNAANTAWTYAHGHWGWCIIWRLEDGTELKRMYQPAQPNADWISSNAPETSKPDEGTCSFVFNGWNTVANTSQQEIILTADYTKTCEEYYDVLWKSEDGTETYETDENVGQGETTRYNGAAPVKADDEANGFTYTFDGWTTEPNGGGTKYNIGETPAATGDATYYAHFAATEVAATVTANGVVTYYPSIADAFTAANASDYTPTIQVWRDAQNTPALTYTAKNHCTLDLNGHTVSGTEMPLLTINDEGYTFTVTDRTETKEGRLAGTSGVSQAFVVSLVSGVFRLEAGTVYGQNTGTGVMAGVYAENNREIIINGGTIQVDANLGTGYGIFAQGKGTINGGTIRVESSAKSAYAVQAQGSNGNVTITDGKFYAAGSSNGTVTCVIAKGGATLTVNGGYYNTDANLETYKAATCRVYSLPSTKLPYRYTVTEKTPLVASVTINSVTTEYSSFLDAWSAVNSASAASTLKLLDDVDLTTGLEYTNASKNCTLDLNGHIISGSATPLLKIAQNGITFTITDLSEAKEGRIECNTHINGQKWAVEVSQSTLRFEGGTIYAKNTLAGQLFIGIYSGSSGVIEMSGGNIHIVTTANNPTYGVLTFSTATISSGSIQVEAAGTGYAVEARNSKSNVTITGGDFYATGSSAACVHTEGSGASLTLQGGYYNTNTNLAPKCATNYHVFPNDESPYLYKVAEGYTVTFNANGHGTAPEAQFIEKNTHATTPTAPTAEGYTFGGWYKEAGCETPWNFASDVVTQATTLFAKWTAINYSISYELNGGSVASENPTSYTVESSAITLNNPTKANYVFAGWTGTGLAVATMNVTISAGSTGDRSYTATWTPAVASVTVNEVTTYYTTFDDAWTAANSATAASTLTLLQNISGLSSTRTYSASHDLMLNLNGHTLSGSGTSLFQIGCAENTFTVTDGSANHDGKLSFTTAESSTSSFHCVIVNNGTFVLEAGTIEATSSTVSIGAVKVAGGTFTMKENGAVHAKYTGNVSGKNSRFVNATGGTTNINGGTIHLESTSDAIGVVYSSGNVTFNGGKFHITASGTAAVTNQNGAKNNLNIRGGYYSANTTTYFEPHVKTPYHIFSNSDATYIYRVAEAYTLTWSTDGDALTGDYTSGYTEPGATITAPATPTKTGYTFKDWGVTTPAAVMPSNDLTYTATWTANQYTITFDSNGGSEVASITQAYGTTVTPPADPTRLGYNFTDWTPAVPSTMPVDGAACTAQWEIIPYDISYTLDGGTESSANPTTYNVETATFTLNNPTKEGYTFLGWTGSNGSTPQTAVSIANGSTGDKNYTANWAVNVASVTVNGATTYYTTIDATFTAANASATYEPTITLLKDAVTTTTSMLSYTGAKNCTLNLNGHTLSSTTAQALLFIDKANITFTITDLTESKAGGLHLESTGTVNRWCVYVKQGNLQLEAGTIFLRSKADTRNEGVRIDAAASTFTMNGGKVQVVTTDSKPARGIVSRGIAVINDGEIQVEASGTGYGIEASVSEGNIGNVTVTGGKFLVTGSTAACAYKSAAATLTLQGGYYNTNTGLDTYCATDYQVFPTTAADKASVGSNAYNYKVAVAYKLTWSTDGDELTGDYTSGYLAAGDPITQPNTPTKTGYTFSAWIPAFTGTMPAEDTEYTATWTMNEVGDKMDIVDWTATELTINANGWAAAGWPYTINGTEYQNSNRAADRTLTIPYSGEAGSDLRITVESGGSIIRQHYYRIPYIGTTDGISESDILYVNSGNLTIDASSTPRIAALYIRPEASVTITGVTLAIGKLVLRTLPWQAAAINGSFTAEETWYTRIAPNNRTITDIQGSELTYEAASYYQFALPLNTIVQVKDIKVSHGANTPYGKAWLLKSYNEATRAASGAGDNWDALSEYDYIRGGVGYEMFSSSAYYREFYFPVGPVNSASLGTTTSVAYDLGNAGVDHAGWNIVASPLMGVYDNSDADPETGLKVSLYLADGSYDQGIPSTIAPAIPFSYQASSGQSIISFDGYSIVAAAPRRVAAEDEEVRLQWLHLDIKSADGIGDHTSVLAHPTRYEESYKTGIDVAKQSFTASRALIYSSHAYGEMAFAGVSDALLEAGIPLTVYSPAAQELTFSLRENKWLERMAAVWLVDLESGAAIDLLDSDYSYEAAAGTTAGRFLLQGRFRAPEIATDLGDVQGDNVQGTKAHKIMYREKLYILIGDQLYDATGKMVNIEEIKINK